MSKIKNDGLDQHDTGPLRQQQFGIAGVEGIKMVSVGSGTTLLQCELFLLY